MSVVKNVVASNMLGFVAVGMAVFGIVGGSFVVCGACWLGMYLAGG